MDSVVICSTFLEGESALWSRALIIQRHTLYTTEKDLSHINILAILLHLPQGKQKYQVLTSVTCSEKTC